MSDELPQEPLEAELKSIPEDEEVEQTLPAAAADDEPFTALIVLSDRILFKPDANVLHIVVQEREDLASCLTLVGESALDALHLVVRAQDVESLFDPNAVGEWSPKMIPGAELTTHVVADGAQVADDDVDAIRMALVMAEFRLAGEVVEQPDGSKVIVGRKPGGVEREEEEPESDGDDDGERDVQKDDKKEEGDS